MSDKSDNSQILSSDCSKSVDASSIVDCGVSLPSDANAQIVSLDPGHSQVVSHSAAECVPGAAAAHQPGDWAVGDLIHGRYQVLAQLGRGGMGVVYRVLHNGWNRDLAVKRPRPDRFRQSGNDQEQFVNEAESWINLGLHPHIVYCHYTLIIDDLPCIFAEYIEGGSLQYLIRSAELYKGGRDAALARILDYGIQLAWGLHYAHEQGLIHQDVKPTNVMVTRDGTVKVTDFGLAKARSTTDETAPYLGRTHQYCSPEQAEKSSLTRHSDIWNWGLTLLEAFAGKLFWEKFARGDEPAGPYAQQALTSFVGQTGQDPRLPAMPARVIELLERCFQPEIGARPQSLYEAAEILARVYQEATGAPYRRRYSKAGQGTADSLNNRALSLYDLGRAGEAEKQWQKALAVDPYHIETIFNYGVIEWRNGRRSGESLIKRIESTAAAPSQPNYKIPFLSSLIRMEEGDLDSALELIGKAEQLGAEQADIEWARAKLPSITAARCLRNYYGHGGEVLTACFTKNGKQIISGGADKTLVVWHADSAERARVLKGHNGAVTAVAVSPDGLKTLADNSLILQTRNLMAASGSLDETIKIWDLEQGVSIATFQQQQKTTVGNMEMPREYTQQVHALVADFTRNFLVSGNEDAKLRIWKPLNGSGKKSQELDGHKRAVHCLNLSGNSRVLISGSADKTIIVWQLPEGIRRATLKGHAHTVRSVHYHDGLDIVVSGSDDATIRVWHLASQQCQKVLTGHDGAVNAVAISPDGSYILSGGADTTVRLWELASGRCIRVFRGQGGVVTTVAISNDGRFALTGSRDGTLSLWKIPERIDAICKLQLSVSSLPQEQLMAEAQAERLTAQAEAAVAGGDLAAAIDYVTQARALPGFERAQRLLDLWQRLLLSFTRTTLRSAWRKRSIDNFNGPVTALALSKTGRQLYAADFPPFVSKETQTTSTLTSWALETGGATRQFQTSQTFSAIRLSNDGRRLAGAEAKHRHIKLWQTETGELTNSYKGHSDEITAVFFSYDDQFIISTSLDRTIRLWETRSGRGLDIWRAAAAISNACLSKDERLLLTGDTRGNLHVWELASGRIIKSYQLYTSPIISLDINEEGSHAIVSGATRDFVLVDLQRDRVAHNFTGHEQRVNSLAFTTDGRFAVSASDDKTVKLWDIATAQCLWTFRGHNQGVLSVIVSLDERYIVSGGRDSSIIEWELDWNFDSAREESVSARIDPYLTNFLALTRPYGALPQQRLPSVTELYHSLTKRGRSDWQPTQFDDLLYKLSCAGFGRVTATEVSSMLSEKNAAPSATADLPAAHIVKRALVRTVLDTERWSFIKRLAKIMAVVVVIVMLAVGYQRVTTFLHPLRDAQWASYDISGLKVALPCQPQLIEDEPVADNPEISRISTHGCNLGNFGFIAISIKFRAALPADNRASNLALMAMANQFYRSWSAVNELQFDPADGVGPVVSLSGKIKDNGQEYAVAGKILKLEESVHFIFIPFDSTDTDVNAAVQRVLASVTLPSM